MLISKIRNFNIEFTKLEKQTLIDKLDLQSAILNFMLLNFWNFMQNGAPLWLILAHSGSLWFILVQTHF